MDEILNAEYIEMAGVVFFGFLFIGVMGLMYSVLWNGFLAFLGTGGAYRPDNE